MSPRSCPRLFEVEAARDGRLGDAELASFAQHLGHCELCASEAQALAELERAVRALSAGQRDELHVRRERSRLLAAFNSELVRSQAPRGGRARMLQRVGLVAGLIGLSVLGAGLLRAPSAPSAVEVRPSPSASWTRHAHRSGETVRLTRGALWIHVDHGSRPGGRLRVALPDGELEDIGTTFTVASDGVRTTRVAVMEGRVVLRVRGRAALTLGAGERWSPEAVAAPASSASARVALPMLDAERPAPSAAELAPLVNDVPGASTRQSRRTSPPRPARPGQEPSPGAQAAASEPAHAFRAAVDALRAGDPAGAEARLAAFLAAHGHDPRAEDAAYLQVIAVQRQGNEAATRTAAHRYLARFPNGFRREEVLRMSLVFE